MICRNGHSSRAGFTLLELSVVLVIIATILGMGLVTFTANLKASQYNDTVTRIDEIEKALLNYAITNNRIPCPANLTLTTASANYGLEAGASAGGTGTGECVTGMTPAANFKSASGAEEGGVPTRALQLPDDYIYDGWGHKFRYAVDPSQTKTAAPPAAVYSICGLSSTGITVNDASGAARTTAAAYAIISHGANGHGAYTSNGVMLNAGSVNASELVNCHCNSSAVATTYTPTYVEMTPTQDPANALDNFDDIVTFKEPWQFQTANYPLSQTVAQCVYVTDRTNSRVQIFNSSGTYVSQFGSLGSGNGQLDLPIGTAIDSSGNVWVVDSYNKRLQQFTANGTYSSLFGAYGAGNGQFYAPTYLAIDGSGNIWVTDGYNNRVQEFNKSGTWLLTIPSSCVAASVPACSGSAVAGQFNDPSGIAIDHSGNIWVVDTSNNRVEKFNSSGTYLSQFPAAGGPITVAIDSGNNLWVPIYGSTTVNEYNSSGTVLYTISSPGAGYGAFGYIYDIAIDSSNNIWLTDVNSQSIYEFNNSGTYLNKFGSAGSGNGQFAYPGPYGIATTSSR